MTTQTTHKLVVELSNVELERFKSAGFMKYTTPLEQAIQEDNFLNRLDAKNRFCPDTRAEELFTALDLLFGGSQPLGKILLASGSSYEKRYSDSKTDSPRAPQPNEIQEIVKFSFSGCWKKGFWDNYADDVVFAHGLSATYERTFCYWIINRNIKVGRHYAYIGDD